MKLEDIRRQIDLIDIRIIKLLNDRMERALMAKKLKNEVEDSAREQQLLAALRENSRGLIAPEFAEQLYTRVLEESKRLQHADFKLAAFQGEHGAYSEVASRVWNKDLVPIPYRSFADVFAAVHEGICELGIVPVENSLGGAVGQVNDLLTKTDLEVVGAVELPVHHCLLAVPGTDHREIRAVYSHAQALAQCRHFLKRQKLEPKQFYDTAGAAKMLADTNPPASACIASNLAAEFYNLDVIKENIEDLDTNTTRFLVIAKEALPEPGSKCSIVFTTAHKAGCLFGVLELFAKADINLSRIESVPNEPGSYAFFLDFAGSKNDEKVTEILTSVESMTASYKFLGCYNERKGK
jgi:prephenate dehydratase/chorismate mutase